MFTSPRPVKADPLRVTPTRRVGAFFCKLVEKCKARVFSATTFETRDCWYHGKTILAEIRQAGILRFQQAEILVRRTFARLGLLLSAVELSRAPRIALTA
jgi:hypothetical protein